MYGYINTAIRWLLIAALFGGGLLKTSYASAQGVEAKLKAAYVANIASFVRWHNNPLDVQLCVSSNSSLYVSLKELEGHPLGSERFIGLRVNPDSTEGCHIIFSDKASGEAFNAMALSAGANVLTVGDLPKALQQGFAVQLFVRNLKLRFVINTESLDKVQYQISSKLLRLSRQLD